MIKRLGLAAILLGTGAAAVAAWGNWRDKRTADVAWSSLRTTVAAEVEVYDPAMVADLPAIAQRYFARAIAPGTPLLRTVEVEMHGSFLIQGRGFPMQSEQILAPPRGFVWRARMGSGLVRFGGSDGYLAGSASWTRFRLFGLLPLARAGDTEDHARAAAARMAMETIWVPAALLPRFGAVWREAGPDVAEVSFPELPGIEPILLTLDSEGRVVEVVTRRWTDANPEGEYRFQPFGGRMRDHGQHQGFTIPTEVEVGNFFGTDAYEPFFRATVSSVEYR